ncbi:hypothetical protein WDV85_16100 [Pseudokineococcus sp. 5B2Z-1]|uniref:hypothetical protein n=1 Tax=Pseudokineococcus sp. 5B2Z-1 TaxID=3132744 RepID=UPI0030AE02AE
MLDDARTAAPTSMPVLARGRHRTPRTGACFMEMASYLAGERWSDHPACTHPLLARLARDVNDRTSDSGRARLGRLVPSVVGLHDDDPATDVRLALLCTAAALPVSAMERQHALAVALLAGQEVLAHLEGRPDGESSEAARAALARVPGAAAWARRFTETTGPRARAGLRGRGAADRWVRGYLRHGAPSAVSLSVAGVAGACGVDADALLHDLLVDAVALVRGDRAPAAAPAPDRWAEACRLSAAGRR